MDASDTSPRWHRIGALVIGLVLGPLAVQGILRLEFLPLDGFTVLVPTFLVVAIGAFLWTRGKKWFGSGVVIGACVWTAVLAWIVITFARSMADFPD